MFVNQGEQRSDPEVDPIYVFLDCTRNDGSLTECSPVWEDNRLRLFARSVIRYWVEMIAC